MKLISLYIEKYKNLENFNVDFEAGNGLTMFVGNNGSGKSNVLEAISGIFHDLFKKKSERKIHCDYTLIYKLNDINCKLEQKKGTLHCYGENHKSRDSFVTQNAPGNIIGLYSGEEDRLWTQFYESYYKSYIRRIKTHRHQERMKLIFINKYYWNVALLTLLLSSNETLVPFIKNELGINAVSKITLQFDFRNYDDVNALLKTFIDRINPDQKEIKDFTIEELKNSIFYSVLTDENGNTIVDENNEIILVDTGITDIEVFRHLTQACMPKQEKIIKEIMIYLNDNITVQQLSEGEKKLILVKTVLEVLSDEKTLLLMDEPDAHLHETRKKNLYSIMSEYPNRQIVLASHSPTFIDIADQDQIMMLKTDQNGNAILYDAEKIEAIRDLTGSRINAFLEKPILYCEGTETSVEYMLYPLLFPEYKIIPTGGHQEVINCTKAYNRTFGDATHYAIGIIDWDYKTEEQLSALRADKIYSLKVVEIENVLMDLTLLEAAKNEFCAEEDSVEISRQKLFAECNSNKENQALKYTANRIVNKIKTSITPEGRTLEAFKTRISEICDPAEIEQLYIERVRCLDDYIRDGKFEELVAIYDFNHNIDRFLKDIVNDYKHRILKLIQKREDLQQLLKTEYYSEIV